VWAILKPNCIFVLLAVKRIIGILLVLVFLVQLLPIREAVYYFITDDSRIEEVADTSKSLEKGNNKFGENNFLIEQYSLFYSYLSLTVSVAELHQSMVPSSHADDVESPPPNIILL
jgi:hypothetical protein